MKKRKILATGYEINKSDFTQVEIPADHSLVSDLFLIQKSNNMQRQILFKAIALDSKQWVVSSGINIGRDKRVHLKIQGEPQWTEVIPETVCQYTGMTAQVGSMLFEEDIVESEDYGTKRATIKWNKKAHSFVLTDKSYGKNFTRLSGRGKLKLIGNTFDCFTTSKQSL